MTEALKSWTRTLNEDDALRLVDAAEAGQSLEMWSQRAHDALPQAGRDRRTELIRMVRDGLLDWTADAKIAPTRWLASMHRESPGTRICLLHGRILFDEPWILRALTQCIAPRLLAIEAPLADRDLDRLSHGDWADFVSAHILPGTGSASCIKTRSTLLINLERLGVLRRGETFRQPSMLQRGQPAPLAFGGLVAYELGRRSQGEASWRWAAQRSRAALLFQCSEAYATRCLHESVQAGVFRHSYLAGEDRLVLGKDP